MKQQSNQTAGIRYLALMLPLFAAVILLTLGIAYPKLIAAALDTENAKTPLASPEIMISAEDGTSLYLDEPTRSALSAIGTCTSVVCYDTKTADDKTIRLMAVDRNAMDALFVLTEGRLPQNSAECVIITSARAASVGIRIGSAVRPYNRDSNAPLTDKNGNPCTLTVVGVGQNLQSALAPISETPVPLTVCTPDDTLWQNPGTTAYLYLTDSTSDNPQSAVQSVYDSTAAERNDNRRIHQEQLLASYLTAADDADNAVMSHQITVQEIENRLDTAELRVSEAENNMMDAVVALQAERQAFVSDMEYNEYYALRQVDLIPRRDRAEEGFSIKEDAIAQMNDILQQAYNDRNLILAELKQANSILKQLEQSALTAHTNLESAQKTAADSTQTQPWKIAARDQEACRTKLNTQADALRTTALLWGGISAAVFVLASILIHTLSRTQRCSVPRFALYTAAASAIGVILGGFILSESVFASLYPELKNTFTLRSLSAGIVTVSAAVLISAVVISTLTVFIGHRMQKRFQ